MASNSTSSLNFGAGPGKIPREVLADIKDELLDFRNTGMSITEISHRSREYAEVNNEALESVRNLLSVPPNYKIIFVPGGGQGVFSAIPMNLINRTGSADYVVAGIWSQIAAKEAEKFGTINFVFPKPEKADQIPEQNLWKTNSQASYLFYCDNETIEGVEFPYIPTPPEGVPLVADMSSNIMTKKFDISKFGLIFAAAQKNLGTAGIALVIVREDLLGDPIKGCPNILNFTLIARENSILNTPPIFPIYVLGKVLKWVEKYGGLEEMEKQCCRKSKVLYDTIQNSNGFYSSVVKEGWRSRINVSIRIGGPSGNQDLETKFLNEAQENRMFQLKGHKLVGGIRVSLYNAVSLENLNVLVEFMKEFQKKYEF